ELEAGLPQGYRHLLQEQAKQKADYDTAMADNEQRVNSLTPQAQSSDGTPATAPAQPVEQPKPVSQVDALEKRGLGALAELPLRKVQ
ncbi:hypothetical protein U2060_15085, partial [Listeria monocytogenes]|uniref:hypothetical protein n=1 Tax=Listeria monocytogenes TaxID=1639 RepID=UPI002FDBDE55